MKKLFAILHRVEMVVLIILAFAAGGYVTWQFFVPQIVIATGSCSAFDGSQSTCNDHTGCTWDTASCSDFNGSQSTCLANVGCSYPADNGSCDAISDYATCTGTSGCNANFSSCGNYFNSDDCSGDSGCNWNGDGNVCYGSGSFTSCNGTFDDGSCNGTHDLGTCSGNYCGDGTCDENEDSNNCPSDCGGNSCSGTDYCNIACPEYDLCTCDPTDPSCQPATEDCSNGIDDDGDGQIDCADSDCSNDPSCQDTTAPQFVSGTINNNSIVLNYDDALTGNCSPGDFSVDKNGDGGFAASTCDLSGSEIHITPSQGTNDGDSVQISYTRGGSTIADASNNYIDSLTNQSLTNVTPPRLSTAEIDGNTLLLHFDTTLSTNPEPIAHDIAISIDGTPACVGSSVDNVSASTVSVTMVCSAAYGDTVTVTYNQSSGWIQDATSNHYQTEAFNNALVQNNTQVHDTTPPGVSINAPVNGAYINSWGPSVNWDDAVSCFSKMDNGVFASQVCSSNGSDITGPGEGVHTLQAYGIDGWGNSGVNNPASVTFTYDSIPPLQPGVPDLEDGSDGGISNTDNLTNVSAPTFFVPYCEAGATVHVQLLGGHDSLGTGDCSGGVAHVILTAPLTDGNYSIESYQVDRAGNVSSTSGGHVDITIDTAPPNTPATPPDLNVGSDSGSSNIDNVTSVTTPFFDVYCYNGNDSIRFYMDGVAMGSGPISCASGGTVSIASPQISELSHSIAYTEIDQAGNESPLSSGLGVTIDTIAPSAPGTPDMTDATDSGSSHTDNITNNNTPDFIVRCDDGAASVILQDGSTILGSAACVGDSATISSSSLSEGLHNDIKAKQTDEAGNESGYSSYMSVTIDNTAPLFSYASVDTSTITLYYGENLSSDFTPTRDSFFVLVNGVADTVSSVMISANTVILTLHTPVVSSDAVSVTYVKGVDSNHLQDAAGNETITLASQSVQNNTDPSFAPSSPAPEEDVIANNSSSRSGGSQFLLTSLSGGSPNTNDKASTPQSVAGSGIPTGFNFTQVNTVGSFNDDVRNLQKFLNENGFIVATSGNGSPGHEIRRFGLSTKKALAQFQKAHGIKPALGYFGPVTKAYINHLIFESSLGH